MADKNPRRNPTTDALFDAILSLETREECYNFFEDLCTVKEISDMAQRLEAAKLLLGGSTYDQIVKAVEISTATISPLGHVDEHDVGQVLGRDDVGCGGTDVAGADDGYLGHVIALLAR